MSAETMFAETMLERHHAYISLDNCWFTVDLQYLDMGFETLNSIFVIFPRTADALIWAVQLACPPSTSRP